MKRLFILSVLLLSSLTLSWAQGSLKADYYNGTNFEEYVGSHYVTHLDFYWDDEAPIVGLDPNNCSVLYTGQLRSPRSGTVSFSARVDDGILVWIDDVLIISNWQLNDAGYSQGKIHLKADSTYSIKVKYFNAMKEAEIKLLWKLPPDPNASWFTRIWEGTDAVVVPSKYLSPPVIKEVAEKTVPEPESQPKLESKPKAKTVPKVKKKPAREPLVEPVKVSVTQPITKLEPEEAQDHELRVADKEELSLDTIQKYLPKNVEFKRAKAVILPVSYAELNKLAMFLANNPIRKVTIEGHTDVAGDSTKNLVLSQKRAKVIAAYLVRNGVKENQIAGAVGYGSTRPISKSDDRKYHPENRRVEFFIE